MGLVKFHSAEDRDAVVDVGIYHFDKRPLIVSPWSENMYYTKQNVERVPVWVQLEALDLKYWGGNALSKIVSLIGTPIMADKMTMEKERIQYARVLVDVNVHKMPDVVYFQNERGIVVEQKVKYEWRPSKCTHCQGYGHEIQDCRKKAGRMEWRPKWIPTDKQKEVVRPEE